MVIGEVCIHTDNVIRLARFYRELLGLEGNGDDAVHQFLISEETMFSIYNDGVSRTRGDSYISLAFTVDDVDVMCGRLAELGARIVQKPQTQPWGARNLCALDPDGNVFYLRSLPKG